ncbi:MAG TPA: helix-hairpin-helix domain-containing protein [Planctomycetota bacterium]|jgi:competence ComEA-like helix-hairpin-helix protein
MISPLGSPTLSSLTMRELLAWAMLMFAVSLWAVSCHWKAGCDGSLEMVSVKIGETSLLPSASWRLDLNTATAPELEMLPGIGPRRAQLILQERRKRGAFTSVWDLREIPGFTRALVQRLDPMMTAK